jgi:nitroreductase
MTVQAMKYIPSKTKQKLRAFLWLPFRLKELMLDFIYDLSLFTQHSSTLQFFNSRQQRRSWIDADFHKLEKGMALKAPRPNFGKAVAQRLSKSLAEYIQDYGPDSSTGNAIKVLSVYKAFKQEHDIDYPELFGEIKQLTKNSATKQAQGGCIPHTKDAWLANSKIDFLKFVQSRHSMRNFSSEKVDFDLIKNAIEMAMYTPTVCNRQAVKVHAYSDENERRKVIDCQMGNAGFGEQIQVALVISVDRQCFFTAAERNQCWIDGGLFSMSLVYALHSLGLGACCLNWCADKEQDLKLKKITNISQSEAVIMMVGVGHLNEEFSVAQSPRKSLDHFLVHGIKPSPK